MIEDRTSVLSGTAARKTLTCAVCGQSIANDGGSATFVRTAGVPWQWIHEGSCSYAFEREHWHPPPSPKERVLELFEQARAAGRLQERGHG